MFNRKYPLPYLGIFLISASILIFEISLTRIFSIIQTYHYVFVVVSFAILGLGLGGIIFYILQKNVKSVSGWILISAICFSISIPISVYLLIALPLTEGTNFTNLSLYIYILISIIPFILGGVVFAGFFREAPQNASLIYGADLLGAAFGAVFAWILLQNYGGVGAALFSGFIAGCGVLSISFKRKKLFLFSSFSFVSVTISLVLFFTEFFPEVPVGTDLDKDLNRILNDEGQKWEIIESKWSAFGRTDLVREPGNTNELWLFIDGAAGTPMLHFSGSFTDSSIDKIIQGQTPLFFPFLFLEPEEKDNALIIGPGGGKDVLVALAGGVKKITAVEVNPDIVYLVKKYSDFNGGVYTNFPSVELIVEEGRQYVRNSKEKFDLIMIAIPVIKSKRGFEGYTLTENYLFTKEAFEDYLDHLTPEGRILILGHGDLEVIRLVTTALKAFESKGIDSVEGMRHIYTLGSSNMPLFVLKKSKFTKDEAEARHDAMHFINHILPIAYFPYIDQAVLNTIDVAGMSVQFLMFNESLVKIAEGLYDIDEAFSDFPVNLLPTYDDRPFFYDFNKGLPSTVLTLFYFFLILLILLIWLSGTKNRELNRDHHKNFHYVIKRIAYIFTLLGLGYMAAEISIFQKIIPLFKHPSLALTVLLAALLVGTGTGSLLSLRIADKRIIRSIKISTTAVFLILFIFIFFISKIRFNSNVSYQLLMILFLFLTGLFMGFPFPLLIRHTGLMGLQNRIPWFWGINGVASVAGSTFAVMLAKTMGWYFSLGAAALFYLIIVLIAFTLSRNEYPIEEIGIKDYISSELNGENISRTLTL